MVSDFKLRQIAQNIYDKKPGYTFEKVLSLYPKYFIRIHLFYRSIELQHMKDLEKAQPVISQIAIKNTTKNLLDSIIAATNIAIDTSRTIHIQDTPDWQEHRKNFIIACENEINTSRDYTLAIRDLRANYRANLIQYAKLVKSFGQQIDVESYITEFERKIYDIVKTEYKNAKYYIKLKAAAEAATNVDEYTTNLYRIISEDYYNN